MGRNTERRRRRGRRQAASPEDINEELGIEPLEQHQPTLNIGIYGDSGYGKTRLACSIAEIEDPDLRERWLPALIVDPEHGTWSVRTRDGLLRTSKAGYGDMKKLIRRIKAGRVDIKTVIIDSVTDQQKGWMAKVIEDRLKKRPDSDPESMEQADWGTLATRFREVYRDLRDLPINLIVTALASEREDEDTGDKKMKLALQGQFREDLPAYLDVVGYLTMVKKVPSADPTEEETREDRRRRRRRAKVVRTLVVQPTNKVTAKDRSDVLGDAVEEPTMEKILEQIYEGRALEMEPA